jgi:class 3 adenylate cyclase/tetratricopeptide (TPR) repeat protein
MRCPSCNSENPHDKRFCLQCGLRLEGRCSQCGAENPPGARFCGDCGAELSSSALSTSPAAAEPPTFAPPSAFPIPTDGELAEPRRPGDGERRHLTVLFCDLVGSTEIAAKLDPEDWRATVAGYQRAAAEAITRFGGHVAKYLGDGVMAFFGYPEAHDNDADHAVRAGLAILDAITKLNEQPAHAKLAARVGVDSGSVVVGAGAGKEADAFGDAPNIAARVQASAVPDTLVITDATHRLVSGFFVTEERGVETLKGIGRPVQLYRVLKPSGIRGRLQAGAAVRGLISFVGREDELRTLMNRWERVCEGEGQVVTIIGEAGIGKSRLVQQFHDLISASSHTWLECATAPFYQNTPFYAVEEIVRQSLHWDQRLNVLEVSLGVTAARSIETVSVAASSKPNDSTSRPPSNMTPEQERKRLMASVVGWTLENTQNQPLVVAIEDLHWADPSTLELIQLLVEQGATARLLLLCTARPEFRAPWPSRAHQTQITVNRLSARHVRTMVGEVAAQKALSDQTVATVVERTGGVPLFVEELTRAVLESGDGKLTGSEIPATLHDSLMARLDRLGAAKEVIQIGAVIGSDFSYDLLHAIHPAPEPDLQAALRSLTDAELLYVRGIAPDATYRFKHALIRDAAYEALLKSRRKELHLRVARSIDEKFPTFKETHPEVLARHWMEAGEADSAITEWQTAGARAVECHAYSEAEQHYGSAIAALRSLPESSDRDSRELTLQVALGDVMQWTRGWSSAETVEAYTSARTVAERSGGADSLKILAELCTGATLRGEQRAALALADQVLAIAHRSGNSLALITAQHAQAFPRHILGDLIGARQLYSKVMAYYREEDFSDKALPEGVSACIFGGHIEWYLGYPDRAVRLMEEALSRARRRKNPFAAAFALAVGSHVYELRRDYRRSLEAGDEAVRLNIALELPFINALGKNRRAWARAQMGDTGGAADQIQAAIAELNSMKFYGARATFLVELAETQAVTGAHDEALVTVEQAVQTNPDELLHRPLALRLRGELRLCNSVDKPAHVELAEKDFREAIDLSRSMSAKSLELRATMSLARLLTKRGRRDQARTILADIYNWFTEGFDTADLKDAKVLLDELGA